MDDDFIKEKLNMITKDDEILEVPAPESLKALSKEYAQKFAERQNKKQTTRRRYLVPVFSSVAAAVLVCVALLCFTFFHKPEEDTRYSSDFEYVKEQVSYEQIIAEHDILLYKSEQYIRYLCYEKYNYKQNSKYNYIISIIRWRIKHIDSIRF